MYFIQLTLIVNYDFGFISTCCWIEEEKSPEINQKIKLRNYPEVEWSIEKIHSNKKLRKFLDNNISIGEIYE